MQGPDGGSVPGVDPELGQRVFRAVHAAISRGLVRSCHDLSEAGLAVALAEMALAGGLGAAVSLDDVPRDGRRRDTTSSSCSPNRPRRFLLEVPPRHHAALADLMGSLPLGRLGEVGSEPTRHGNRARAADRHRARRLGRDRRPGRRPESRLAASAALVKRRIAGKSRSCSGTSLIKTDQ